MIVLLVVFEQLVIPSLSHSIQEFTEVTFALSFKLPLTSYPSCPNTFHSVWCLQFSQQTREDENVAWPKSCSLSQLLHSSVTGKLSTVYDLCFYWAELWLC